MVVMTENFPERVRQAAARVLPDEPGLRLPVWVPGHRPDAPQKRCRYRRVPGRHGPRERYLDLRLRLPNRLSGGERVGDIEVVVLNEVPLPVRGRAVRDGIVIYSRDEPARVRYEGRTLKELFDFEIHDRPLTRSLLQSMAGGHR